MELKPGDVIVVRCERLIRAEFGVYLQKKLRRFFPDHEVIVIDGGIELQILSEPEEDGE